MVIAGSVLTALLIAVSSGYLIYRIAFYKKPNDDNTNGDQSNDGDKNKMSKLVILFISHYCQEI